MRRIFGTKKEKPPPPTMDQAVDRLNTRGDGWVGAGCRQAAVSDVRRAVPPGFPRNPNHTRLLRGPRRLDEKIRKLDEQLAQHKQKIKSTRGPAQEAAKRRALAVLKQKRLYESQRDQLYNQQFNVEQTAFAMTSMQVW